jgi:hypothetical protein
MSAVKVLVNNKVGMEAQQEQERIQAQIEALKARQKELKPLTVGMTLKRFEYTDKKTGELRSGLSIYGISKRPVNLFGEQAERLFGDSEVAVNNRAAIVKWLADNAATLTKKVK